MLLTDASGSSRCCPATNFAVFIAREVGEHIVRPLVLHATWACQLVAFGEGGGLFISDGDGGGS